MTQDMISGHNQAFILKKILQQFKFLSGKLFQFALIADFMTGYINPEVFAVQFPLLVLSCAAPENCFYHPHRPPDLSPYQIPLLWQ